MKTKKINYLDMTIQNTGNGDGWVVLASIPGAVLSERHCGNFQKLDDAKRKSVMVYMIIRPLIFLQHVSNRALYGHGCSHEFFLLKRSIEKDGLIFPDDITSSDDINFGIHVCGKTL